MLKLMRFAFWTTLFSFVIFITLTLFLSFQLQPFSFRIYKMTGSSYLIRFLTLAKNHFARTVELKMSVTVINKARTSVFPFRKSSVFPFPWLSFSLIQLRGPFKRIYNFLDKKDDSFQGGSLLSFFRFCLVKVFIGVDFLWRVNELCKCNFS